MKIQVLVTTMHQKDIEKYHQMNLQTDAIIANQCDVAGYLQQSVHGHTVQLVSEYIKQYLTYRYGDYMKLPSKEQQKTAVHAEIFDVSTDFREYFRN